MDYDEDFALALQLQQQFQEGSPPGKGSSSQNGISTPLKSSTKGNSKECSIVDEQWEYVDPTPDVHALFLQFNDRFFWGKLAGCEVRWSPRMTLCAGMCCYEGRGGLCSIRLSLPLLKLRPRKDLVETLLHEMIHAYLFVTANNKDRDGHGPEFLKHMNRINCEAGTRISVFHNFHDEVNLYKQHWWRCDGPCKSRRPFFGMVKRAMNRAPGPTDNWWGDHQATCGGTFHKIKEPPEYTAKKQKEAERKEAKNKKEKTLGKDIRTFFPGQGHTLGSGEGLKPGSSSVHGSLKRQHSAGRDSGTVAAKQRLKKKDPSISGITSIGKNEGSSAKVQNGFSSSSSQRSGGGGGMGGTRLANGGGGTIVITSRKNKDQEVKEHDDNTDSKPTLNIVPFSGKGYTLGGIGETPGCLSPKRTVVFTPDRNYKSKTPEKIHIGKYVEQYLNVIDGNRTPNRASRNLNLDKPETSTRSENQPSTSYQSRTPEKHVQKYVDKYFKAIGQNPGDSDQQQTVGNKFELPHAGPSHDSVLDYETSESLLAERSRGVKTETDVETYDLTGDNIVSCPVCYTELEVTDLNSHLDVCVSVSPVKSQPLVKEDDDSDSDATTISFNGQCSGFYPCPSCSVLVKEDMMNAHLDACLQSMTWDD